MAKIIDITEKLDFQGKPIVKVKDTEIEVNDDAATMLEVMGILGDCESPGPKEIIGMYNLVFTKEEQKKIDALKLIFSSFTTLINEAIELINSGGTSQGEQ